MVCLVHWTKNVAKTFHPDKRLLSCLGVEVGIVFLDLCGWELFTAIQGCMISKMKNINYLGHVHPYSIKRWRKWKRLCSNFQFRQITHVVICQNHFGEHFATLCHSKQPLQHNQEDLGRGFWPVESSGLDSTYMQTALTKTCTQCFIRQVSEITSAMYHAWQLSLSKLSKESSLNDTN